MEQSTLYTLSNVLNLFQIRNKDINVDEYDLLDIAYDMYRQIADLTVLPYGEGIELKVDENRNAILPCNVYKVDQVFRNNAQLDPKHFFIRETRIGINLKKENVGTITADLYFIPVDEDGNPEIDREMGECIYWTYMYYQILPKWTIGDISGDKLQYYENKMYSWQRAASGSLHKQTKNHRQKLWKNKINVNPKTRSIRGL